MTYRQLLARNPDFRRLWTGQVVSEVGDWLNNIAVLALTIQLAGPGQEGRAVAVYAIARHLPLFLFGPVAGVVADRFDRRRLMVAADVARALLALGFFASDRLASLPLIYAVGAGLFVASSFFNAAKRASIPNIVGGANELLHANALSASTSAATIAVGSALGGLVSTFAGRDLVFLLNAASFLASAELIRRIRRPTQKGEAEREATKGAAQSTEAAAGIAGVEDAAGVVDAEVGPPEASTSRAGGPLAPQGAPRVGPALRKMFVDFRGGLGYVRRDALLGAAFAVAAAWGLGAGAGRAVYSLFGAWLGEREAGTLVERPTDFGISLVFVAMGAGGTLGAPVARRLSQSTRAGLAGHLGRSMVFDGLGLVLLAATSRLWVAALVLVAREVNFAVWWTAMQTLIMRRTDDRFAGRVFASYETLVTLMMVGAMLASGAAADTYGFRLVAAAGGAVIVLAGALWFVLRPREGRDPDAAAPRAGVKA